MSKKIPVVVGEDGISRKTCTECGEVKPLDDFSFRGDRGVWNSMCRDCVTLSRREYHKEYEEKNKEKRKLQHQIYHEEHKEESVEYQKQWYQENKEKKDAQSREWFLNHPEESKGYYKKWYDENLDKVLAKNERYREAHPEKVKQWAKQTRANIMADPKKKLRGDVSRAINKKLENHMAGKKNGKSSFNDLLPYTIEELMAHLESKFEPGMTWENRGKGPGKWHCDHDT